MTPLLTVEGLTMRFGGIAALERVGFTVSAGSITALIGPNGAGKTTVFNCLTGFYQATAGAITLQGPTGSLDLVAILGQPLRGSDFLDPVTLARRLFYKMFGGSHRVTRAGVARTFQNVRLFKEMTVMENLLVAQHLRVERNLLAGLLGTPGYRRAEQAAVARGLDWLQILGLRDAANRLAGELPYGDQRRLEIARALCTGPRLLCLDEPAAGLNPRETEALSDLILRLRTQHGLTILLIEHDMSLVMRVSDHVVVLDHGEVIARGTPQAVRQDPRVLTAYLGMEEEGGP
ncbi:MAG: ATP-binding cassette domain-containing protein [Magnetococcales bacterium]|nr:ATP-binding cassette domain-containing protein [Magnetococcales bacterium]